MHGLASIVNALYNSTMNAVEHRLLAHRDEGYAAFMRKLVPTLEPASIFGVRAPALARFALSLVKQEPEAALSYLDSLPHETFEGNMLHASLLGRLSLDFPCLMARITAFLPYVDNWAVCDSLPPKAFAREADAVAACIPAWLQSEHPYTVRFALVTLIAFFLEDARFAPEMLQAVAALPAHHYYINMAAAWYVSCALVKQYERTLPLMTGNVLDRWVHNKAIQKALESFRIPPEHKAYLKTLRRKAEK